MKFVYYLQDGIMVDALPDNYDKFFVAEDIESSFEKNRYFYPGDEIQYKLDSSCVELYNVFQNVIFPNQNDYYKDGGIQPQWISRAGLDSDFDMPQEEFAKCISTPIDKRMAELGVKNDALLQVYKEIETKKFKFAYIADCQSLVNTLQELLAGCHSSFLGFFKHLCSLNDMPKMGDSYFECGAESRMVYSFLYSFIIQCYSSFDILTKIEYELENIKNCETAYAKLSAANILYGNKKSLNLDAVGTVFERCRTISTIENLRNELVHNAAWEISPKIFVTTDNNKIVERHIFMPDFTAEGTLVTFKNRKRFFAQGKKTNEELPKLYFDILKRVYTTLDKMIKYHR